MRLKKVKNAEAILNDSPNFFTFETLPKLSNAHLEIGVGKGDFIIAMAKKFPTINFIGIEKEQSVLVKAIRKLESEELTNVYLLATDALTIGDNLQNIDKLYLNFSDPWPKKKHHKRRLTAKPFLEVYQKILQDDGLIVLKSDNDGFFASSLVSMNNYNMEFITVILDLHNSSLQEENIMTEYEHKFSKQGFKIKYLQAKFKK